MGHYAESCVLCGAVLREQDARRRKRPSQLRRLCERRFRHTPLVWREVMSLVKVVPEERGLAVCMPCTHWISRLRTRKQWESVPLPLDSLLLFCLFPFSARVPDARILRRFVHGLFSSVEFEGVVYGNIYTRLFPERILGVLRGVHESGGDIEKVTESIIGSYCGHSDGNMTFGNSEEMRRVRRRREEGKQGENTL